MRFELEPNCRTTAASSGFEFVAGALDDGDVVWVATLFVWDAWNGEPAPKVIRDILPRGSFTVPSVSLQKTSVSASTETTFPSKRSPLWVSSWSALTRKAEAMINIRATAGISGDDLVNRAIRRSRIPHFTPKTG